jgi:nucleotide-binding universal stress UspA family protein
MRDPLRIERILCPTDFSVFSTRAFRHALALSRQFGARLKVLHVIPHLLPAGGGDYVAAPWFMPPEQRKHAEEVMRLFVAPALEARAAVEVEISEGEPWREIEAAAERWPADLVVMGTHGRGGLEQLFLGSVSEKLMHHLPCPVLTVCHEEGRTWESPGLVERILCATDFSEASALAVDQALALAEKDQAKVTVLHVIESVPLPGEPLYRAVPEGERLRIELEKMARERLRGAVPASVRARGRTRERLALGRAYEEILKVAAEERPDLIVIGAGTHGPLGRMFVGSNAHHVVRQATCPVLTVRPRRSSKPAREITGGLATTPSRPNDTRASTDRAEPDDVKGGAE